MEDVEAMVALERALLLKPDDPSRMHALARAIANHSDVDFARAEDLAREAATQDPTNAEFRMTLGEFLRNDSKYLAATTELEKVLMLSKKDLMITLMH